MSDPTIKGLAPNAQKYDGSAHRIAIVHARWNDTIIAALVAGTIAKLKEQGVKEENIVVKSVPGAYELPFACRSLIEGSKAQSSLAALGSTTNLLSLIEPSSKTAPAPTSSASAAPSTAPFSAVVAIGCLLKGSTMHFEYICDAVTHGLMKVQLETGTPVIFGVLTCLTDDQALDRAGLGRGPNGKGHNHGEDYGMAAVEIACQTADWSTGKI
ncbi:6,7-dimethyl-8-ribityllumazine synthase, partial [Tremellales sp. Uapishka_1]